jgi:hypothetical protein
MFPPCGASPLAAKAAIYFAAVTARLKPRPFKGKSQVNTFKAKSNPRFSKQKHEPNTFKAKSQANVFKNKIASRRSQNSNREPRSLDAR